MKALESEADKLDYAARHDAFPKSSRAEGKRRRAGEIRALCRDLDSVCVGVLTSAVTASEIVDAMSHDGDSIVFSWQSKKSEPRFREVPHEAVLTAVASAMRAARPPMPGQVIPLRADAANSSESPVETAALSGDSEGK